MEWKKPFALFAGSFGIYLSSTLFLLGSFSTDPRVAQDCPRLGQGCVDVKNWTHCNSFSMLMCTYLDDFKSFGYDNVDAKAAIAITCFLNMILNALLIHGLIAETPKFIDGYQIGNFLSTIALMSTLVYVSYLNLIIIS